MKGITEAHIRDFFYDAATSYGFVKAEKELIIEGLRIDMFAIDVNHNPFIIEFKKKKDRHIVGQAAQYLAIVPSYQEEIAKKISFYQINWEHLRVILVAPAYYQRDLTAANYTPLQNRVHFYTYKVVQNSRKQIFGLPLTYIGPAETGPIKLPEDIGDPADLIDVYRYFEKLDTPESKRAYYTNHVIPIFERVKQHVEDFFMAHTLYFHTSYFGNTPPYYMIRVGTAKKQIHRASIMLGFYQDAIVHGFDLTHSLAEGQLLARLVHDEQMNRQIVEHLLQCPDYRIYIPNTGFDMTLPLGYVSSSALSVLLMLYAPKKMRDCYFRVTKAYEHDSLSVNDAAEILMNDYEKFKLFFGLLRNHT
ncbi:hypothetical protein U27_03112 [Candidatus Vecturithrix granuli]|uniref:DUF91 domain-containing protein n=1 Tax=Vecturithrix granuli TaxID=1499967 RepID=A0A081BUZ5_VECG1|nr:hypothetical protein U27_03112 [Candidatus Vecturithrix granuli]